MSAAPRYSRTQDIIEAEVGGEIVVLHTQNWQYYEFDRTGATIWGLLQVPRDLGALVDDLVTQFDVDRTQCTEETKAFLDDMIEQGLVTTSQD
jgi:hypothetical protein